MKYSLSFIRQLTNNLVQFDEIDLRSMFLDYFNNYLSVSKFAEHNYLSKYEAERVIEIGRKAHEDFVIKEKAKAD